MAVSERTRFPVSTVCRKSRSEHRARHRLPLGPFPGSTDLAEHLRLPEDGRVEARRDSEQMGGHVVVEPDRGVLGQVPRAGCR